MYGTPLKQAIEIRAAQPYLFRAGGIMVCTYIEKDLHTVIAIFKKKAKHEDVIESWPVGAV